MSSPRCAAALVAQLCVQGVRDAVLAPGSRSAPLALALARAEADGLLRLHVRIDERSAGYLALGLAKAGGRPVAVVTTSGTAVGNLLPAVMERMGFDAADQRVVSLLVQHHLLLPETATRRDLDDPRTATTVAEAVGEVTESAA